MAATISATGTWTVISFSTTDVGAVAGNVDANVPRLSDIDFYGSLRDTDFSELEQFIQIVATAYGITNAAAHVLIQNALQIRQNRGMPSATAVYP
jgi:hypothetical protein